MSVTKLPMFKGYFVDEFLEEFRKFEYGKSVAVVPFDSPRGQKMLKEWKAGYHAKLYDKVQREIDKGSR